MSRLTVIPIGFPDVPPDVAPSRRLPRAGRWAMVVAGTVAALLMALAAPSSLRAQAAGAAAAPAPRSAGARYTAADVAFMQGMIGHHAQALEMTALIAGRSTRRDLAMLGERITVSQRDEIRMMAQWLTGHGESVPAEAAMASAMPPGMEHGAMSHGDHAAHLMPGMLSVAQMDSLRAARGSTFDRHFLRYMIQHHEGALVMVQQLHATPGAAEEPQVYGFAADVDTDQRAEIRRMQTLLDSLQPSSSRP